jgi:RNA polymerase sigma-70 factor (ECF subfamily)
MAEVSERQMEGIAPPFVGEAEAFRVDLHDEDVDLVAAARAGDAAAFRRIVLKYQRPIYGLALRMMGSPAEAEDMAQEAFVKAYDGLAGFRGEARLRSWLFTIATNHCLNALRARRRRREVPLEPAAGDHEPTGGPAGRPVANGRPTPEEDLVRAELRERVRAALETVTPDHQAILVLRDIQGLPYEEIAAVLGIELGTVRSRLHRARMELRARLTPYVKE